MPTRVLVIAASSLLRAGIAGSLLGEADLEFAGAAASPEEGSLAAPLAAPDVIIREVRMTPGNTAESPACLLVSSPLGSISLPRSTDRASLLAAVRKLAPAPAGETVSAAASYQSRTSKQSD